MRRGLILATAIVGISFPACAQQGPDLPSQNSQKGSAFPSPGSNRGPAFPKSVAPTESNPTNWAKPPSEPDPSSYNVSPRATYCTTEHVGTDKSRSAKSAVVSGCPSMP